MILDNFDKMVLEQTGNASEIMLDVYGKKIGKNNAEKQMAGVRTHIKFKNTLEDRSAEPNKLRKLELTGNGGQASTRLLKLSEEDLKSPEKLLELHGYNIGLWKLEKATQSIWNSPVKDEDSKELYSSRIEVKPRNQSVSTKILQSVFDELAKQSPPKHIYRGIRGKGYLLELPIMDLHLGKLAWRGETEEDYDLKIAEFLFKKIITDLLESIETYNLKIEQIVFPVGQDYFHFDTSSATTTKGTIMDTDTRWQKMFRKGVQLLAWGIENLRQVAPVKVIYVPGNHDRMLSYFATATIEAYFRNCEQVEIDLSGTPRKYMRYGQVLLGWAHGADERNRIEHLMQIEAPEDWGLTKFREFHLGHVHHEDTKEKGGVIIRNIASVTATDAWHKNMGFVGNVRKAQAFVWSKERGKIMTLDFNVLAEDIEIEEENLSND